MHRRRLVAGTAALALGVLAAPAYAADGGGGSTVVTATITGLQGERTVASVTPVALAGVGSTLSGPLTVTVAETTRAGTNPWSVTATMTEMTSGANTLPASALSLSNRGVTALLGGGTATAPAGSAALSTAQTLFTVSNQSPNSVYTGTYTGTSDVSLSLPTNTATGVYTGTLTVTLVQ